MGALSPIKQLGNITRIWELSSFLAPSFGPNTNVQNHLAGHPTWRANLHTLYAVSLSLCRPHCHYLIGSKDEAVDTSYLSLSDSILIRNESSERYVIYTLEGFLPSLTALISSRFQERCTLSFAMRFERFLIS